MASPHKSVISRNTSTEITQLQDENQSLHFKHKNASSYPASYGSVWSWVNHVSTQPVFPGNLLGGLNISMIVYGHEPPQRQSSRQRKSLL